jgi:hypothetical protein
MTTKVFDIESYWWDSALGPALIAARLLDTIDGLTPLNPMLANWRLVDMVDYRDVSLAEVRSEPTAFVERNVAKDHLGGPQPGDGYDLVATSSNIPNVYGAPQTFKLYMQVGSEFFNSARFMLGRDFDPRNASFVTYPVYRGVLEALVSAWPCPWALAYTYTPAEPPAGPNDPGVSIPRAPFGGAWIAYLSAPFAAGLSPPDEIRSEPTPGGGLILSAVTERIDETNPDHVRRSRLLQAIMNDRVGARTSRRLGHQDAPPRAGEY